MGIPNARARVVPSSPSVSIGKGTYSGRRTGEGYGAREIGWQARRWVILRDMPEGLRKLELLDWVQGRYSRRAQPGAARARLARNREGVHRRGHGRAGPAGQAHPPDGGGPPAARVVERVGTPVRVPEGAPGPGAEEPAEPGRHGSPSPNRAEPPAPGAKRRPVTASEKPAAERRRAAPARAEPDRRRLPDPHPRPPVDVPAAAAAARGVGEGAAARAAAGRHRRRGVRHPPLLRQPQGPRAAAGPAPTTRSRSAHSGTAGSRRATAGSASRPSSSGPALASSSPPASRAGRRSPTSGCVVQADKNFYTPLRAYRKRQDKVIAARKRGKGKEMTYEFMVAGEPIEIPAGLAPDLDALLHRLADEAEMRAVLDSLPDGWRLVKRPPW